jgi:hypothetical protein
MHGPMNVKLNIPLRTASSPFLSVLFSFRLERLMEDVQAHSSFQHLDKVCLQFTVVRHFLVFMKFNL